jgi:hypothetical protein
LAFNFVIDPINTSNGSFCGAYRFSSSFLFLKGFDLEFSSTSNKNILEILKITLTSYSP